MMFEQLAAPFPAEAVSWRVGSTNIDKQTNEPRDGKTAQGLALAYLDARDVMGRLDDVCGPAGWQNRYSHVGGVTVCEIGVRIFTNGSPELGDHGEWKHPVAFEWLWKADGAGATDVEAEKGALSDAFKRAAVRWGIGQYLYGLKSPWVNLEKKGRTWVIKNSEYAKLRDILLDADFHGAEGSPGSRSAYAAKKDGGAERFNAIKAEIESLGSMTEIGVFTKERTTEIKTFPEAWRKILREALDEQKLLIAAQAEEIAA